MPRQGIVNRTQMVVSLAPDETWACEIAVAIAELDPKWRNILAPVELAKLADTLRARQPNASVSTIEITSAQAHFLRVAVPGIVAESSPEPGIVESLGLATDVVERVERAIERAETVAT